MSDPYAVEGTGPPETRLNIDEFSTNPTYKIRWDLFLRALAVVQTAGATDPMGYYGIAGIHGLPLVTWPELKPQPGLMHYCSHGNVRFPTWHRPYLYLLEQALVKAALTLANLVPDPVLRAQYTTEAQKVRIPFWDWGVVPALPASATGTQASVNIPEQSPNPTLIPNPLFNYTFPKDALAMAGTTTTRYADQTVADNLKASGLRALVYHSLTVPKVYAPYSNTYYPNANEAIETPHNDVHVAISAIMSSPDYTAFDPIFWVFHGVMDYYYALWQTVNPGVFYSENYPNTDTIDYPLTPFNRAVLGAWTSRMVQQSATQNPNTWVFGVQYPETQAAWTDAERLLAAQRAIVRYAPLPKPQKLYPPGAVPKDSQRAVPGYLDDLPIEASIRREWRVLIKVKNNLVPENFTIFVFLGEPGEARDRWGATEATVGSFSTFKAPLESCENCKDNDGNYMYGSVYLTDRLHELLPQNVRLHDREALTPWLIPKLDWRIRKADGTEFTLPAGDTTSLSVGVESFMEAYVPLDEAGNPIECDIGKILGRTFDRARHPDITRGKADKGGEIITG